MPKKYKLLLCAGISAIFLISYGFKGGETTQPAKTGSLPVTKARQRPALANIAEKDDMVAAILIMPKSYLPALEKFSNSAMAKDMTILKAKLEFKDGQMTAVSYKKEKQRRTGITSKARMTSKDRPAAKHDQALLKNSPKIEKQMLATGFVYFLASIHKGAILH
jgi:hypothetical protein